MEKENRVLAFLIKTQGVSGAKKALIRFKEQKNKYLDQGKKEF